MKELHGGGPSAFRGRWCLAAAEGLFFTLGTAAGAAPLSQGCRAARGRARGFLRHSLKAPLWFSSVRKSPGRPGRKGPHPTGKLGFC